MNVVPANEYYGDYAEGFVVVYDGLACLFNSLASAYDFINQKEKKCTDCSQSKSSTT